MGSKSPQKILQATVSPRLISLLSSNYVSFMFEATKKEKRRRTCPAFKIKQLLDTPPPDKSKHTRRKGTRFVFAADPPDSGALL